MDLQVLCVRCWAGFKNLRNLDYKFLDGSPDEVHEAFLRLTLDFRLAKRRRWKVGSLAVQPKPGRLRYVHIYIYV